MLFTSALSRTAVLVSLTLVGPTASVWTAPSPSTGQQAGPSDGFAAERRSPVLVPTLTARATLSADYSAPGPDSGALATPANGRRGPFPGQVIPGFSGAVHNRDGTYWAMPDNGFGTKANSADFLLRIYRVKPRWETACGGRGEIRIKRYISLRDPDHKIPFDIVHEDTEDRLLTGQDFDIESIQRATDGSFWIGDEFGPWLLHVDRHGKLLQAPVPFPDGKSPDNATLAPGETPNTSRSRGLEAVAARPDGHRLYPILEGSLTNDPNKRRRVVYEFDTLRSRYTGRTWAYRVDTDANMVADAQWVGDKKLLVIERDDFNGPPAVTKRVYRVDLNRRDAAGFAKKSLFIDLLNIANPNEIGVTASPGAFGVGKTFKFPFQSVETVVPLGRDQYFVASDNNYPTNDARYPGTPDDTEMIIISMHKKRES
jgi:glycerophosphoryl diester phosphodiesterase